MVNLSRAELKEIVSSCCSALSVDYSRLLLFGSRARQDNDVQSDYDIMIITKNKLQRSAKFELAKKVRIALAEQLAGADVLIISDTDFDTLKDQTGSVVRNVELEGVIL